MSYTAQFPLSRMNTLSATTSMDLSTYLGEYSVYDRVYSEEQVQNDEKTIPRDEETKPIEREELKKEGVIQVENSEKYKAVEFGTPGTLQYRSLLLNSKEIEISFWHDVPLYTPNHFLHFVCKTPKGSWVEYETALSEPFNPLKIKSWVERPAYFSENTTFNYGMLPQTCSDPHDQFNGHTGGRPLEIIDIGSRISHTGEVYVVKPLAAFAVIDMGAHVSWKIIAVSVDDESTPLLNDVHDIEELKPGLLGAIREWLKSCHSVDPSCKGKTYGLNETAAALKSANQIVSEAHLAWKLKLSQKDGSNEETWNLPLPRPISSSVYEAMWKKYTGSESSTVRIPLSDSVKGNTSRYERAWIDTYSPKWNEGLFGLTSPPVQFSCTVMPFTANKRPTLKTNKTATEQWRKKFFEALDRQAEDSPKITFSTAMMNYAKNNVLLNPHSTNSLMERRRKNQSLENGGKEVAGKMADVSVYNHRRNRSLSRFGQQSPKEYVVTNLPTTPKPPLHSTLKSNVKPTHKPQVTTTKNLMERIQQEQESHNEMVGQMGTCH